MSMKRIVSAAAVAAGVGISAVTLNPGFASSAPLDPPPCPNCHGGGGGGGGGGTQAPQAPETPQSTAPPATHSTAPPATPSTQPPATHSTAPPATQSTAPSATQSTQAPATQSTQPSATQSTHPSWTRSSEPSRTETTQQGGQTTAPSAQTTAPASGQTTAPSSRGARPVLNPPSTQPPHPAYVPRRDVVTASAQIGGPTLAGPGGAKVEFVIVDRGAPPPPRERGYGWNDGPAPHHAPPGWYGPPPRGGWDGPPPPGGWNRPWDGPRDRDWDRARYDYGPFNYDTFTVFPVFNWMYGGWGYWFFGVWVPLY